VTRNPPHDLDAERCVLGSMMLSQRAAVEAIEALKAEDFYNAVHGTIFDTLHAAVMSRRPVDVTATAAALDELGDLQRIGGAPYLHTLIASVPTAANVGWYARIVTDRAGLRRLIEAGTRIVQIGYELDRDPAEAAALAGKFLADATPDRSRSDLIAWSDIVGPATKAIGEAGRTGRTPGVSTGIAALDQMTGGLHPGQLAIVAGRPGMGKSVLGVEIARRASIHRDESAAIFSLEMSRQEVFNRIASAESGISLSRITRGELTSAQWTDLVDATARTERAPLHIDDSAPLSLADIIAKARRLHSRQPQRLLVIDYLQLVTLGRQRRDGNREQEVAEIARGLKLLAKELQVPVIAAAQLNRNLEARADKRPQLSDLRESGAVEQDSDIVIMLYRDAYYNAKTARPRELELIAAKNRHGPKGTVIALADFEHGQIIDPGIYPDRKGGAA
jgi:replicative DNA helicase